MSTTMKYAKVDFGTAEAVFNKLGGVEGVRRFLAGELELRAVEPTPILRLVSAGQEIIVAACDGTETLAEAKDVFTGWVDPDFANWNTNVKGEATGQTPASVYELIENATFQQMFSSLNSDLNKLCWTQAQIKAFVRDHQKWLHTNGYATFFLFKVGNEFFVADVYVRSDGGLRVDAVRFSNAYVWSAGRCHRVVTPQLTV